LLFTSSKRWPIDDKADPLTGWPIWAVHNTPAIASQDAYGKLFIYLSRVMLEFLKRVNTGRVDFEIYRLDVKKLPRHLATNTYNRIEVSMTHISGSEIDRPS
jgi:hypothetical protein